MDEKGNAEPYVRRFDGNLQCMYELGFISTFFAVVGDGKQQWRNMISRKGTQHA